MSKPNNTNVKLAESAVNPNQVILGLKTGHFCSSSSLRQQRIADAATKIIFPQILAYCLFKNCPSHSSSFELPTRENRNHLAEGQGLWPQVNIRKVCPPDP